MRKILIKCKSNRGFTMQDVIVAMVILVLFAGVIGSSYVTIYKIQAETKLNATATLCAIQILENIDKIDYDQVNNGDLKNWRADYEVPNGMNLSLEVKPYNEENIIKNVKLTISYEFAGKTETLVLEKIKVKEL